MKKEILKKKLILLFLLGAIFYGYFLVLLGGIWGYLWAKIFSGKKEGDPPKFFKSLIIKIKNYKIHLHHWLYSLLLLLLGILFQISIICNGIVIGFLLGMIYHGISSYQDWKVIIKK